MPYKAFLVDSEYCVYKLDENDERTGETLGCHDTKAEADAQVKALYANESDIVEAATLKTRVQALMRDATAVLSDKTIPATLRKEIEDVRKALKKTWADLEADADGEDDMDEIAKVAMKTSNGKKPTAPNVSATEDETAEPIREYAYSFASLRAQRQMNDAISEVQELTYQFRELASNILYSADIENKVSALQGLADEFIDLAAEALGDIGEKQAEFEEIQLGEADTGSILSISESQGVEDDEPAPLTLDVVVIEPGWGNKKDNHYYSAEMLREHAKVFEGAKMYATDHKADEKNVLTEVSQVLECPVSFTETGAPVARVGVFDDAFAQSIRNRAALGKLEDLHVSILANGTARPFEEDGRKGKYVETISPGASVDWVTRAGAGGHALRLAENEQEEGTMPEETVEVLEQEQEQVQETENEIQEGAGDPAETPAEPVRLSEAEVAEALDASTLPDASRERLASGEYETTEQLQGAITAEAAYVAKLTGAGRPIGQQTQERPPKAEPMTDEQYREALDAIDKRFGLR